jgi:hypothetical protein
MTLGGVDLMTAQMDQHPVIEMESSDHNSRIFQG